LINRFVFIVFINLQTTFKLAKTVSNDVSNKSIRFIDSNAPQPGSLSILYPTLRSQRPMCFKRSKPTDLSMQSWLLRRRRCMLGYVLNSQKASRAAQNALTGHMFPAGRVFDTPVKTE